MQYLEDTFITSDGVRLYRQGWIPDQPRADVFFIHGAFEHSGRFTEACLFLANAGFSVHALDLRGHGKSQGEIGPDSSFVDLLTDINSFIAVIKNEKRSARLFLIGQSLGGALALMSAPDTGPSGVILCAPACKPAFPLVSFIVAYTLGKVFPNLKFKALESRLLSRDPAVALAYEQDPLVNRQGIPLRPLNEFMRFMHSKQVEFERKDIPLLIFHGTEDKIIDIRGSRELYRLSCSGDKTLEELPQCYHDLLNDPERYQILGKIVSWMNARL
jgi:alpha-beta hydrolase superfamily lysophospholipase